MKTFNTQVCTTKKQSQRLLELGLTKETADCRWVGLVKDARGNDIPTKKQVWFTQTKEAEHAMVCGFMRYDFIPAWSLHRLISLCEHSVTIDHKANVVTYNMCRDFYGLETIYDNFIDCIEYLIKEGFLNKEYLEK